MIPGTGTAVNVVTVLLGALVGKLLGDRLPVRTRDLVTDALGLTTLLIAADLRHGRARRRPRRSGRRQRSLADRARVLGDRRDHRLPDPARAADRAARRAWLQRRLAGETGSVERQRFIEGFVLASLIFCTGPLTILGSLNDGLGNGADQLFLKATLDGFAAMAFAASFGLGVAASALTIVVVQGGLTVVGSSWATSCPMPSWPRSPRPAACCWSAWRCGCCGSGRSRSRICCPRCWSRPCWSQLAAALR